jgi:hypothetical protein
MGSMILLVAAFLCCLGAAFWYPAGNPSPYRPHLGWLGMAAYFLSLLVAGHR